MSESVLPDIEIYLKRVPPADIICWLNERFIVDSQTPVGETLQFSLRHEDRVLSAVFLEKAVKGGYSSLLFEPNATPWATDEACAEEAFRRFDAEVRCSTGGWTSGTDDRGGWYRFTKEGKSVVNWLT